MSPTPSTPTPASRRSWSSRTPAAGAPGIDQDGEGGLVCIGDGETYILPIEVTEAIYGIQVDRYEFNTAAGGEGKFRGGRGLIRDYRILSDEGGFITSTFGRHKFMPWGVAGGRNGSPNAVQIRFADGREPVTVGKTARYPLAKKGDVARLITGSGGGWGEPEGTRPRARAGRSPGRGNQRRNRPQRVRADGGATG